MTLENRKPQMQKLSHRMQRCVKLIAGFSAAAMLAACVSTPITDHTQQQYDNAIADAAVVSPEKILPLLPLPDGSSVTMISWVTGERVPCKDGQACVLTVGADRLWVTLGGEVQQLCRSWKLSGDPLRRRLEQLLGLPMDPPPQYRKAAFVVMQVPHDRIARPCLGLDTANPVRPACTLDATPDTPAELRSFIHQQMAASYVLRNPKGPGYPFTRLGYTYDWNPDSAERHHYGASEFLVAPGTVATVTAQISTDTYCSGMQ